MKWLRILLPIFLILGMLLCAGVAYADDGDEGDNEEESGLNVDVTVIGDNPDVNIDIIGEDAEVTVNTTGTDIYLNGQNINEPTVIHKDNGVSGGWVKKRINQAVGPIYSWAEETGARLSLTMDGLAKIIMAVKDQDSQLGETSAEVDELYTGLDDLYTRLEGIDGDVAALEGEHDALVDEVRANHQALLFEMELMEWEYNRNLVIMAGAFLLVVMGLGIGFGVSIYQLRKRI